MAVLPPEDPHGDRAWMEARKKAGRRALDEAEPFGEETPAAPPPPPPDEVHKPRGRKKKAGEKDIVEKAEPAEKTAPKTVYRVRRVPRLNAAGEVVWVVNNVPEGFPIIPLGAQGLVHWYLNPRGELVPMEAGKFGLTHIKGLAGDKIGMLERTWPKFNKQGGWTGFAAEAVQDALISAAAAKGVFDPREKVRGRGCWKAEDGQLIQHLGDRVLVGKDEKKPGEIVETDEVSYVYPARPKLPAPKAGGRADCEAIYGHLKSWEWVRGELDARLLLGWMGCVVLGAALDWRPMVFWTGDAGTGKSTLQKLVRMLLSGRLISTVDATPAALAQLLGADSLGVAFDELEADQLTDQAQHVMKLARTAASGDNRLRGGQDHKATEFQLRGCFGFSAINMPSMRQQDGQRLAVLRLNKLKEGASAPALKPQELRDMGAGLVGRITDGWSRWADTLEAYRRGLEKVGHAQRGMDQFGALLAAADVILMDGPPDSDTVEQWCAPLARRDLYEYAETEENWVKCWRQVLAAQPEAWRSLGFPTVAEMVQRYLHAWEKKPGEESGNPAVHQKSLIRAGLAIVHDLNKRPWLAIPSKHQAVSAIFANSDFRAHGGEGAWTGALRNAPEFQHGEGVYKVQQVRQLQRVTCTLYRLDAAVPINGERTPIFDWGAEDGETEATQAALSQGYDPRDPGEDG